MESFVSRRPARVTLWGAWYGSRNVGDQALLLTITDLLERYLGSLELTVLTDDPTHVRHYMSEEGGRQVEALHSRHEIPRLIRRLATSDLFVIGGGVPFFEQRRHVAVMALLATLVRFFRTPMMTWAVSSQVVRNREAKRVFRWVLNGSHAITYRDKATRELFESCDVRRPMIHAADSVFWLTPGGDENADRLIRAAGRRDPGRRLAALTPRTLRGSDGDAETHYNVKSPAQADLEVECFAAAVDWLWEMGYQPLFLPMNTVAPDDDRIASRQIISRSTYGEHALLIDEEVRPHLAPRIYGRCDVSFVARVHGAVCAALGECPVMMYAFAPKHAGIMEALDLGAYSLDEPVANPQRTIELLSGLLAKRSDVLASMGERLDLLRRDALIPAQLAAEIVRGR
jgi:polysaccharide pyruvyl transferase WcaK-like protein